MRDIYAAVDLGSANIKLILGEVHNRKVNVLEIKKEKSAGFRHGEIIDQTLVAKAIKTAVESCEKSLGINIKKVLLTVPPRNLKILKSKSKINIMNEYKTITVSDIRNAVEISQRTIASTDFEIINSEPSKYFVNDDEQAVSLPVGKRADKLGVETYNYAIPNTLYNSYKAVINMAGLEMIDMKLSSTAIVNEAVTQFELETGVVLVDVGHHTTSVSLYVKNKLVGADVINMGGRHITHDISYLTGADTKTANILLHKYVTIGSNDKSIVHIDRRDELAKSHSIADISKYAEERMKHILHKVNLFLESKNMSGGLPVVLVGGTSQTQGFEQMAAAELNADARCYKPDTVGARDSIYVASLGMIYQEWNVNQENVNKVISVEAEDLDKISYRKARRNKLDGIINKASGLFTKRKLQRK